MDVGTYKIIMELRGNTKDDSFAAFNVPRTSLVVHREPIHSALLPRVIKLFAVIDGNCRLISGP